MLYQAGMGSPINPKGQAIIAKRVFSDLLAIERRVTTGGNSQDGSGPLSGSSTRIPLNINMKIFTYNSVLKSCCLLQKLIHT